ncbi:TPA: DnaD domain-containing protein [Streptococcus suis]|uniref:DNA replication protein DnaD n=3 Tax=Streptococcus suis TaxID=1307 RepID=A0A0H3N348_STRS4|nr:DnaD domain-containing protein [Streptococcus suis]ABP90271.1 Putative primosome component and related proteins [Streptococcus suis 05ZYH33]ABP92479.1 Putative primosome component and related proteins [Streptococcus suis 98HAH33]ADE31613.1 DNA replication protein dnaD [Streptococcus suis GZ1]ADV70337.1 putative primosome component-like protein [Streptococcus suis JS14]AER15381.1 putative primosome component-related protein [Streptococcus suis SS12]
MNYSQQFRQGHLVLPAAILFHYQELFPSADDFLIWQFFLYQNSSAIESLAPSEIAQATGKTVAQVNQAIENLQDAGLLEFKTISIAGEIEMIFDALPAFEKLDVLLTPKQAVEIVQPENDLKTLVGDFERELGRFLSPFEIEDLQKTIEDDKTSIDLVRAALKEAVFNNKTNWKYIQAILRNWRREGITTVVQVEAKNAEREIQTPKNVTVSSDFLDAMDLWKD